MKKSLVISLSLAIALTIIGLSVFLTFGRCLLNGCPAPKPAVTTFEECEDGGYRVTEGNPTICVAKDKTYTKAPDPTIIISPKSGASVSSPLLVKGQTSVANVAYRLSDDQGVLAEGTISVNLNGNASVPFEKKITFTKPKTELGTLVVGGIAVPLHFMLPVKQPDPLAKVQKTVPATIPATVNMSVPFTSQAPLEKWTKPYNEACEEASLIMVSYFLDGKKLTKDSANNEILRVAQWEEDNGYKVDVTIAQLLEIAKRLYGLTGKVYYDDEVTIDHMKQLLAAGHPIIIPAAGQLLGNPNFSGQGPPYHMLVLRGYKGDQFITNDPGTKRGEGYVYKTSTIMNVIHDWNGSNDTIETGRKAMLVLEKAE